MKLTLKIKLLPTDEQVDLLLDTIKEANTVCNCISDVGWEKKIFNNFKLHHEVYHQYKAKFNLSSQLIIRQVAKVADAYKLNKKTKCVFKPLGSITYDNRIMTYKPNNVVSLWCIGGRQKIDFVCHNPDYIPYIKGEADLVYKKGKFYLFQTVDVPEEDIEDVEEFIGVDMGLIELGTLSNGKAFNSKKLNDYREKRQKVRSSLQSKGTKGCKKVLKRLSGKERTTSTIINHTISKEIVRLAKVEGKGIAIENLKGIRFSANKKGRKFRTRIGKWNFYQLRSFLTYKSLLNGVNLIVVPPAYTSKTCNNCFHIGNRRGKKFTCNNCNSVFDADENAAKNIALLGMSINHPEKPSMLYCQVHSFLGLKPIPSLCVGG